MKEMSRSALTVCCGSLAIACITSGFIATFYGRDSIALTLVGRNLTYLGIALSGATFAYAGVHALNFWNENCTKAPEADPEIPTADSGETSPLIQYP